MVRTYTIVLAAFFISNMASCMLQAVDYTASQADIKLELVDFATNPEQAIAVDASGSFSVPASYLITNGIRPVTLTITNSSEVPVLISGRSVGQESKFIKSFGDYLKRSSTVTPWPRVDYWATYGIFSLIGGIVNFDLAGITLYTIPAPASFLQKIGGVRMSQFVEKIYDKQTPVRLLSLLGFVAATIGLMRMTQKNRNTDLLLGTINGRQQLEYPSVVHPGESITKILLFDVRKKSIDSFNCSVFAYDNKDVVTTFVVPLKSTNA